MKKLTAIILLIIGLPCFSQVITGEITKASKRNTNQIYDSATNIPIEGVIIKIPAKGYSTKTKKDGTFKLQTNINSPTIMSVEKFGYKPFSMTLTDLGKKPVQIGIEKTTPKDIIVDTNMVHIGDNSFSPRSANADEFSIISSGPFYSKEFSLPSIKSNEDLFLVLGSIIGIDTMFAQRLGQSHVLTAYSSPPEIFFNGNKIAEIKINGDNQKIKIPFNLINQNNTNTVTIKTGRNLYKTTNIDYDDIEFTNLLFEIK